MKTKLSPPRFTILSIWLLAILGTYSCKKEEKPIPNLSFEATISIEEGNVGNHFVSIALKLSHDYDKNVTVKFQTSDGTAIAGEDYVGITEGELMFIAGETEKEIKIEIIGDEVYEENESFSLIINKVINAQPSLSLCDIVILNDDVFIPELSYPARVRQPEGNSDNVLTFAVKLNGASTLPVSIKWSTADGTAKDGLDYVGSTDNTLVFNPGETEKQISITILGDEVMEFDEGFFIHFSNIQNATFIPEDITVVIDNDDSFIPELQDDGFITPENYEGFNLVWADEFSGTSINTQNWGFNTGAGGWGNNELQVYTSLAENSFIQDGKLNIVATKAYNAYRSARLLSKDKKTFIYGRIDFRAKMPIGKGIWPALWTLGNNISTVDWPRCGEIDIMEYLGHKANEVHGTIHYNFGGHRYTGSSTTLAGPEGFNEKFHIFTLLWSEYGMTWYVDYQPFFSVKDTDISYEAFKLPQFFIMNVAVGGNWPGSPDATTQFPQTMVVDYVRVFQPID